MQICGGCPPSVCRLAPRLVPASSLYLQKPKLKPGNSLPLGVEELGQLPPAEGRQLRKSFRRGESGSGPHSRVGAGSLGKP